MGFAFTGVQEDWGNMLVSFVIRITRRNMNLNLHFIIGPQCVRALACFPFLSASSSLSFASADEITFLWQSFTAWKKNILAFSCPHIQTLCMLTHTHTHAHMYILCVSLQCAAAVWQQLRLACVWAGSLEAAEGEGDSVSSALLMNVSLPQAHSLRYPLAGT